MRMKMCLITKIYHIAFLLVVTPVSGTDMTKQDAGAYMCPLRNHSRFNRFLVGSR